MRATLVPTTAVTSLPPPPAPAAAKPDPRRGPPALFRLMREQHGVASRAQARAAGVSRAVERRLVREGSLVRPLDGVLAVGGIWPSFAARCMAASLLPGVVAISHGAAARLHRLSGFDDHELLDVIGRRGARLGHPTPVVGHRSRRPIDEHVVRVGAIPVTSIPLTLVLLAGTATEDALVQAFNQAIRHGVAPATIEAIARAWRSPRARRTGAMLAALPHP